MAAKPFSLHTIQALDNLRVAATHTPGQSPLSVRLPAHVAPAGLTMTPHADIPTEAEPAMVAVPTMTVVPKDPTNLKVLVTIKPAARNQENKC